MKSVQVLTGEVLRNGKYYFPPAILDLEDDDAIALSQQGVVLILGQGVYSWPDAPYYPCVRLYNTNPNVTSSAWTAASANEVRTYRTRHVITGGAVNSLQIHWLNFPPLVPSEGFATNKVFLAAAAIEYPLGKITPIVSSELAVEPNSFASFDVNISLPDGATFWLRSAYRLDSVGHTMAMGYTTFPDRSEGRVNGNTALSTSPINSFEFGPLPWIYTKDSRPSVVVVGDSITWGQGDQGNPWTSVAATIANIPVLQFGSPGEGLSSWQLSSDESNLRLSYLRTNPRRKSVLIALGVNDINNTNVTAKQMIGRATEVAMLMRTIYESVGIATAVPRVDTNAGVQTPVAITEPKRSQYNAWIRSRPAIFDFVFDMAKAVEDPLTGNTWTAGLNIDAVHPSPAGHAAIGAAFAQIIGGIAQ